MNDKLDEMREKIGEVKGELKGRYAELDKRIDERTGKHTPTWFAVVALAGVIVGYWLATL